MELLRGGLKQNALQLDPFVFDIIRGPNRFRPKTVQQGVPMVRDFEVHDLDLDFDFAFQNPSFLHASKGA